MKPHSRRLAAGAAAERFFSWCFAGRISRRGASFIFVLLASLLLFSRGLAAESGLGIFTGHTDIGEPKHAGTVAYDATADTYTVGGSGTNMWFKADSFYYVWKKVEGDIALSADVAFVGQSSEPHRKACLLIRQTLDADSACADVALHGDGLTSLQFREIAGDVTHEVQSSIAAPRRLRLEKIGDTIYLSLAGADDVLHPSGCSVRLPFNGPFYIGLGVCAHSAEGFETARFSHVEFTAPSRDALAIRSSLETIAVASGDRRSVYHTQEVIAAPNWSHDGTMFYFNKNGRIYRYRITPAVGSAGSRPFANPASAEQPELVDTGFAVTCNNNHGFSRDGSMLAITDKTKGGRAHIYIMPATGGTPTEVTPYSPSEFHGWSPDGQTLAYSAKREGKGGIFTIPVTGGFETRLTTAVGIDEGPEFSAEGRWIYFSSDRSGRSQIWRMRPDGSVPEQITKDEYNNRFPHPSPDGKWLVFLSYAPGVKDAPPDRDVSLRLRSLGTGETKELAKLYGGSGTLDAPSWSPDSTKLAYVRYQPKR